MQEGAEADNYTPGLRAYDTWIAALRDPDVNPHGASFNVQYWAECRRLAVGFLEEARERLDDPELAPLFDEALGHYRTVSEHLDAVAEALPMDNQWGPRLKDEELVDGLIEDLRAARAAEAEGLEVLRRIAAALGAAAVEA
jgi:hypothetical protein